MRSWRDALCRRRRRALERLGLNRAWFRELSRYYRHMTMQEFWVRYTLHRMQAAGLWRARPRQGEADYRAFYTETEYFVLRQVYYHRNNCFHWIADALRRTPGEGALCEYGGGVAPVTAWLRPRFPGWRYTVVDLPSPVLEFARWRFRDCPGVEVVSPGLGDDLPLTRPYDVIVCLEVLEHVINPLEVVRHFVEHLKPGGTLFVNFVDDAGDENLVESAAQRPDTIRFLNSALRPVVPLQLDGPEEIHGTYVKPGA